MKREIGTKRLAGAGPVEERGETDATCREAGVSIRHLCDLRASCSRWPCTCRGLVRNYPPGSNHVPEVVGREGHALSRRLVRHWASARWRLGDVETRCFSSLGSTIRVLPNEYRRERSRGPGRSGERDEVLRRGLTTPSCGNIVQVPISATSSGHGRSRRWRGDGKVRPRSRNASRYSLCCKTAG